MNNLRVYADFHNADSKGRLRLNCAGTIQDLAGQQTELRNGLTLTFYSEELEADGQVLYSSEENLWVAVINWNEIRETESSLFQYKETDLRKSA